MSLHPVRVARIQEVCRTVAPADFDPYATENLMVLYHEDMPQFRPMDLVGFDKLYYRGTLAALHQGIYPEKEIVEGCIPQMMGEMIGSDRYRTFVCHIHNARVLPDIYAVFDGNENFLYPNSYTERSIEEVALYYFHRSPLLTTTLQVNRSKPSFTVQYGLIEEESQPIIEVTEPHVLLAHQSASNYAHFLSELMPRLWVFEAFPELRQHKIIVDPRNKAFIRFFAEALRLPETQFVSLAKGTRYKFHHLIHPSSIGDRTFNPRMVRFLKKMLVRDETPLVSQGRRFYLSRKTGGFARRLMNEADITSILKKYDIETIEGADYSLFEQAKLFSEADLVIGLTGAGLTNMLFLPPGKVVIELNSQDWMHDYWRMSCACDIKHIMVASETDIYARDIRNWWPGWGNSHMTQVHPGRLEEAIVMALDHLASPLPRLDW